MSVDIEKIKALSLKIKDSMTVDEDGDLCFPATLFIDTLPDNITVDVVYEYNRSVEALSKAMREHIETMIKTNA
jgi:hypothetical protein